MRLNVKTILQGGALLVAMVMAGCSGGEEEVTVAAPAPAGVNMGAPTAAPTAQPGAETGQGGAPAPAQAVEPQLAPIQSAIQAFEQQNKRMPVNVQELVESGVLKDVPPPPAGKLYYIDHATKQVKMGSDP